MQARIVPIRARQLPKFHVEFEDVLAAGNHFAVEAGFVGATEFHWERGRVTRIGGGRFCDGDAVPTGGKVRGACALQTEFAVIVERGDGGFTRRSAFRVRRERDGAPGECATLKQHATSHRRLRQRFGFPATEQTDEQYQTCGTPLHRYPAYRLHSSHSSSTRDGIGSIRFRHEQISIANTTRKLRTNPPAYSR